MAEQIKISEKLGPFKDSALYAVIFSGAILVISLLVIFPYDHMIRKMDVEIAKLDNELEAQRLQAPLYESLREQLSKSTIDGLVIPEEEKLNKSDITKISFTLKELTEKNNLKYIKSNPDINSIEKNDGRLSVDIQIEGALSDFRNFILSLNEIPYLEDIDTLSILSSGMNRIFKLQIWLAIE